MNRIIVTGFHSSGTSLVTRLLVNSGFQALEPGQNLAVSRYGIDGYSLYEEHCENIKVMDANESLLRIHGCSWDSVSSDVSISGDVPKMNFTDLSVMKDPRFCLTLSSWAGQYDKIIFCFRHPDAAANSMCKRSGRNIKYWKSLWYVYFNHIKPLLASALLINYDDLLDNSRTVLNSIRDFVGQDINEDAINISKRHFISKPFRIYRHEIQVHAMMRSGHHAIMKWLLSHFESFMYYNDPFGSNDINDVSNPNPVMDCLMYNVEDSDLSEKFINEPHVSLKTTKCLVLRDPFNLLASRMKLGQKWLNFNWASSNTMQLWKEHAKAFDSENFIGINYNKWVKDKEYRDYLGGLFDIENNDNIKEVPYFGGGSSFGDTLVFDRWKEFQYNHLFILLLNDMEVIKLSNAIFGFIPAIKLITF